VLFVGAFACPLAADATMAAQVEPVTLVRSLAEGSFASVSIGADERGDALASWSAQPLVRPVVYVAHERAARSRWHISSQPLAQGVAPQLTVDGRGDAVAIWTSDLGPGAVPTLEAAVRPAGLDHWRAPTVIAALQPCDGCEAGPNVVISARGEVLVVWSEGSEEEPDTPFAEETGRQIVEAVSGSARTGRFGPAAALSRATDSSYAPQAALDGRGDAMVVWEAFGRGEGQAIRAAWRPSGGAWRPSITLTLTHATEGPSNPHVAIDADGHAVAVWEQASASAIPRGESPRSAIRSVFGNAATSDWGTAQDLSSPGEFASRLQLVSSPKGRIVAVWKRDSRTSNAVVAVGGRTASGTWGAHTTVAKWGHVAPALSICPAPILVVKDRMEDRRDCPPVRRLPVAAPRVAMNARGDVALVWEQAGGYRPFVRLARWPVWAHDWLTPVRVSAPGASEAGVALDRFGDAFVIWQIVSACRASCPQPSATLSVAELPRARRSPARRGVPRR